MIPELPMPLAREHILKTWPEYFSAVIDGRKPFEVRLNDRRFLVGDTLRLLEYCPAKGYTGRACFQRVSYVLPGGQFGIQPGYCVLGLAVINMHL